MHQFPLAPAQRGSSGRPHCEPPEPGKRRPNRVALPPALWVGRSRCLCYIKGSSLAFHGFLWGLCLPVAAMMIEAVFEAFFAF